MLAGIIHVVTEGRPSTLPGYSSADTALQPDPRHRPHASTWAAPSKEHLITVKMTFSCLRECHSNNIAVHVTYKNGPASVTGGGGATVLIYD